MDIADEAEFALQYDKYCARLPQLGTIVVSTLEGLLMSGGRRAHSVTFRVKSRESAYRKLTSETKSYTGLDDLQDLLGVRVVTYFPDEVDAVSEIVEGEFAIDAANSVDRRQSLDPDRFGYLSVHFVASMNAARLDLTEYSGFAGIKFEIQVRSILQHTWAEIEHDLGYKTESSVPRPLRRRLSRLAGLLELADAEFEAVRDEIAGYQRQVASGVEAAPEQTTIDRDSVLALLSSDRLLEELDQRFAALMNAQLGDTTDANAGRLAELLQYVGFQTVGEVADAAREERSALERFAVLYIDDYTTRHVQRGISLIYLCYFELARRGSREELAKFFDVHNIGMRETRDRDLAEVFDSYNGAMENQ